MERDFRSPHVLKHLQILKSYILKKKFKEKK